MASILIMDMPSSYNVVFGRPILNHFQVVISTHHMKMKFPIRDEVGKVKGGQYQSRRCYVDSVKIADKARTGKGSRR
ncbi:hypothetical protein ACS0TY_010654 [Phlomoides rotata]